MLPEHRLLHHDVQYGALHDQGRVPDSIRRRQPMGVRASAVLKPPHFLSQADWTGMTNGFLADGSSPQTTDSASVGSVNNTPRCFIGMLPQTSPKRFIVQDIYAIKGRLKPRRLASCLSRSPTSIARCISRQGWIWDPPGARTTTGWAVSVAKSLHGRVRAEIGTAPKPQPRTIASFFTTCFRRCAALSRVTYCPDVLAPLGRLHFFCRRFSVGIFDVVG